MNPTRNIGPTLLLAALIANPVTAQPAVVDGNVSLSGARRVMDAAQAHARAHQAPGGAIAVVDAGGSVVLLERLDGTFPSASRISIGKARTAAEFRKPTKVFEEAVNAGRVSMTALPDFFPLQGGVPLTYGGNVVGAIGVSGAASADQDQEIALAGAAALGSAGVSAADPPPVQWFGDTRVRDAFARGVSLLEGSDFKINPSRRDGPGEAEVHLRDTDIFYILEGSALFVTGGDLVGGRPVSESEIRGASIENGETRELTRGDVIVIPRGVPHWFRGVSGPFTYYTVKVTGVQS